MALFIRPRMIHLIFICLTSILPISSSSPVPTNASAVVQRDESVVVSDVPSINISSSLHRSRLVGDCNTGNPIDDCWRCDPDWSDNRQRLADCAAGFGRGAVGGRDGKVYVVNDSSDDAARPAPGTLRYGLVQDGPLWIVFDGDMTIRPGHELVVTSHKTVDGRGADVVVGDGGACFAVKGASNVIVHGLTIRSCRPAPKVVVDEDGIKNKKHKHGGGGGVSDGDGVTVLRSADVWIDHCTLEDCADGLVDVVEGSTRVTVSNCLLRNHNKAMLLGHSDDFSDDKAMRVTVAFNRFGPGLVQRMPRCRFGLFHVINNDYIDWQMYAIGGSASPTILSHGNRFSADKAKEVTKRENAPVSEWSKWRWISDGDLMLNGAFFTSSGSGRDGPKVKAPSFAASASSVESMTASAGALSCKTGSPC